MRAYAIAVQNSNGRLLVWDGFQFSAEHSRVHLFDTWENARSYARGLSLDIPIECFQVDMQLSQHAGTVPAVSMERVAV